MAINGEVHMYHRELNRRENTTTYINTLPFIFAFEKQGSSSGDPDHEDSAFDFSVTPATYDVTTFEKSDIYVKQLHITIFSGTPQCKSEDYGSIAAGLANGIQIGLIQDGNILPVSPMLQRNRDYQRIFNGHISLQDWDGKCVYTCTLMLDVPIILRAGTTDSIFIIVQDDLSSLDGHFFSASGWQTRVIDV